MDTTSNSSSIQADAFFVWDPASKTYVNLKSSITGLAPETLNTLNELAVAVGGYPNFASNLQTQVDSKADASTTYTKNEITAFLLNKTDDAELTTAVGALNTSIGTVSAAVGVVAAAVNTKAAASTTYTKDEVTAFLLDKTDDAELTTAVSTLMRR